MPRHMTVITRSPVFTNGSGALVIHFDCSVNGGNAAILEDKTVIIPSSSVGDAREINQAIRDAAQEELGGALEDDIVNLFGGVTEQTS